MIVIDSLEKFWDESIDDGHANEPKGILVKPSKIMTEQIPKSIPACAEQMLARPSWFADPGVVRRTRLAIAGWLPRVLSSRIFAGTEIAAITLGRVIYFRKPDFYNPHTPHGLAFLAHEIKHVEQFERHGWAVFCFRYFIEYLRHGYGARISFEAEAFEFERQVSDNLRKEFKHNPGRSICWDRAGPHLPNNDFIRLHLEEG